MAHFVEKLGSTLIGDQGEVDTATALDVDIVGFYFSAHWCPPCRGFTPILGQKYEELKAANKSFELVFVSSDRDEDSFVEYHASMPFLALPYSERRIKQDLSEEYGVRGIPSLVLLDGKTGELITKNGRNAMMSDVTATYPFDDFRPKPMYDLSESTDGINEEASLVVLLDGVDDTDALCASLLSLAIEDKKQDSQNQRIGKIFTGKGVGESAGVVGAIRSKCGLGPAPCMVIVNLSDQGAVYKPDSEGVDEDSINAFLDAFKAGSLTRQTWGEVPVEPISHPELLGPSLQENIPREDWACSACTFSNKGFSTECAMCGTAQPSSGGDDDAKWACSMCTFLNAGSSPQCDMCGSPNPSGGGGATYNDVDSKSMEGKYLALYFSAHWCPPCRAFTPQLAEWYTSDNKPENMEVIFVSADRDQGSFDEYFATMPWRAIPYNSPSRSAVEERMNIRGYPTLVILAPDGSIVTKEAVQKVMQEPTGFPWADN